jgi:hypothetical protein
MCRWARPPEQRLSDPLDPRAGASHGSGFFAFETPDGMRLNACRRWKFLPINMSIAFSPAAGLCGGGRLRERTVPGLTKCKRLLR